VHTRSLPSLSTFLALLSVLVTPALLSAQQMDALSDRTSNRSTDGLSTPGLSASLSSSPMVKHAAAEPVDVHAKSAPISDQNEFAVEAFTEILAQYRKMGNREAEAQTLCALANSYNALHRQQKAVEDFQSALAIWRELGDKDGEATTLTYIGSIYREWGFPQQAIRFYREALKIYPGTGKKAEEAAVLNNLGLSFCLLRDKKSCVTYLDRALASYHAIENRQGEAATLTNLGSAYGFLLNDPHKSLDYFQLAVTKLELLNDRASEANALDIMGELWLKLGKPEMAAISFQHALALFSQTGNAQGQASVRKHLVALEEAGAVASIH
jgi:tetratricopeptide (TPR) repeat protein